MKPMKASRTVALFLIGSVCCASLSHTPRLSRQIVTSPIAHNALDFFYFAIAQRGGLEAWFCLKGYVDPSTENTLIQNISPVFVDSADGINIVGRPSECRASVDSLTIIGTVHFHPDMNKCAFSDTDLITAHWLPYIVAAIMCRDSIEPRPHIQLVYRSQIDSAYKSIKRSGGSDGTIGRTFVPIYRYPNPAASARDGTMVRGHP